MLYNITYLRARIKSNLARPSDRRNRWCQRDMDAINQLIDAYLELKKKMDKEK